MVIKRDIHLVQHADWCGVRQEHRKYQRHRSECLLSARKQGHSLRLLARRTSENLEPRFQRIVGFDQLQRSEEHTSELQSRPHLVCRLLLEKKKKKARQHTS